MGSVFLRAASLTLMIVVGAAIRAVGLVDGKAGDYVKIILMHITLPAAIITNFSRTGSIKGSMAALIFLGIAANLVMVASGAFLSKSGDRAKKAYYMNCLPAYNIGTFCLPFIQNFLPPLGTVAVCLFDAGNSLMCTGGTYSITMEYLSGHKNGMDMRAFFKRLCSSAPLVTYVAMIVLSLLHVEIPDPVLVLLTPAAEANTFVAMLMLGLMLHMEFKKSYVLAIVQAVTIRQLFAVLTSLFYYFALPYSLAVRQALVLASFGPMSVVSPVFTGLCGGDEGTASAANSVTIVLSVVEITILLVVMGVY